MTSRVFPTPASPPMNTVVPVPFMAEPRSWLSRWISWSLPTRDGSTASTELNSLHLYRILLLLYFSTLVKSLTFFSS
ncbi:MAG: hypothetical protein ACXAEX_21520 [Promethearchaeota archaeon]